MKKTSEEKNLLSKLASGMLDGLVGDTRIYHGYKDVYTGKYIKDGIPVSFREGESLRFFNGKENEVIPGKRVETRCETDEEKIGFLQKYGFLIDDDEVKAYSAKFKPRK